MESEPLLKSCPRCGAHAPLDIRRCPSCMRAFRTPPEQLRAKAAAGQAHGYMMPPDSTLTTDDPAAAAADIPARPWRRGSIPTVALTFCAVLALLIAVGIIAGLYRTFH